MPAPKEKVSGELHFTLGPTKIPPFPPATILPEIPKLSPSKKNAVNVVRSRYFAKVLKPSTVSVVGRRLYDSSVFVEEKEEERHATLDECMETRPPLRFDLSGPKTPGPTTYDLPTKIPRETYAPAYSMRPKTHPEKDGGDRVSWKKNWFSSNDVWKQRADFDPRYTWPSPVDYTPIRSGSTMGSPQPTLACSPSHTFGARRAFSISKSGSEEEPAPNQYEASDAHLRLLSSFPAFTIRRGRFHGTMFLPTITKNPGPGSYTPQNQTNSKHNKKPSFTIPHSPRIMDLNKPNCTL